MRKLIDLLENEERYLLYARDKILKLIENLPEGSLNVSITSNGVQYKHRIQEEGKFKLVYIKKENLVLAKKLAQKNYLSMLIKPLERRIAAIKKLINLEKHENLSDIFSNLSLERKALVVPVFPTYQDKLSEWKSRSFKSKAFEDGAMELYTSDNVRVRSKSEVILANTFIENGIAYKYECPLFLNNFGTVYPDFTFLSPSTHQEIIWEHFGRMDDPEYARIAIRKIELYQVNGFMLGERLLLSFETSDHFIKKEAVQAIIDKYLK